MGYEVHTKREHNMCKASEYMKKNHSEWKIFKLD